MRTRKTVIILVSGLAGAGKTTVSDLMKNRLNLKYPELEIVRYSLSSPIKYVAQAFFDWDKEKDEKGRKLLQQLGTVGREYNENLWIKHLLTQLDRNFGDKDRIYPVNMVIVDDWRFPNEVQTLRKNPLLNVVTIRVFGRGGLNGEVAEDISENSLPEATAENLDTIRMNPFSVGYDFCVENSGDLEQLNSKIDVVLSQLEKQYIVE